MGGLPRTDRWENPVMELPVRHAVSSFNTFTVLSAKASGDKSHHFSRPVPSHCRSDQPHQTSSSKWRLSQLSNARPRDSTLRNPLTRILIKASWSDWKSSSLVSRASICSISVLLTIASTYGVRLGLWGNA